MRDFQYLLPQTLEEAVAFKKEHGASAVFMAGATDVVVRMRDNLMTPDYVIDLKAIPGLDEITFSVQDGLRIGALATMNEIAANEAVRNNYPTLAKAAGDDVLVRDARRKIRELDSYYSKIIEAAGTPKRRERMGTYYGKKQ